MSRNRDTQTEGNNDLHSLKTAHTPVARLYNWSVLQGALSSVLRFDIDMDTKALLVAGDTGVALALLSDVVSRARDREENRQLGLGDDDDDESAVSEIDISSRHGDELEMQQPARARATPPATPPSEHVHEMHTLIAKSISSGLKLKKSRAMGLAQQKGALGTLLVNGLHAQFEPVVMFVQHMVTQAPKIAQVLDNDVALMQDLLSTLSAGLVSRSRAVAVDSATLLSKIGDELTDDSRNSGAWRWLTQPNVPRGQAAQDVRVLPPVGLQAILASVEIRSGMDAAAMSVLGSFCQGPEAWSELMEKHVPTRLSPTAHMDFIRTHMVQLASPQMFGEERMVEHVLQYALLYTSATSPPAARSRALVILSNMCSKLSDTVDQHPSAGRQALSALKRACRDQQPRMQIVAHAQLFDLLNNFLQRSHTLAPLLYKTLIFSLIEHHQSEFVRQFVASNMSLLMRRHQDLPVGVLIEPLLRQLALHGYNNLDFDFFVMLARHSKLELRHVLQLLDLVHGLCLVDALHGRLASVPYLVLLDRFHQDPAVTEAVQQHCAAALAMFMELERQSAGGKSADVRKTLVLEMLAKVANLAHPGFARPLRDEVRAVVRDALAAGGSVHPGLRLLLSQLEATVGPTPTPPPPPLDDEEPVFYKRDEPKSERKKKSRAELKGARPRHEDGEDDEDGEDGEGARAGRGRGGGRGGDRGRGRGRGRGTPARGRGRGSGSSPPRSRRVREQPEGDKEEAKPKRTPKEPRARSNQREQPRKRRGLADGERSRAPVLDAAAADEDEERPVATKPKRRKPKEPNNHAEKKVMAAEIFDSLLDDIVSGVSRRKVNRRKPKPEDDAAVKPAAAAPRRRKPKPASESATAAAPSSATGSTPASGRSSRATSSERAVDAGARSAKSTTQLKREMREKAKKEEEAAALRVDPKERERKKRQQERNKAKLEEYRKKKEEEAKLKEQTEEELAAKKEAEEAKRQAKEKKKRDAQKKKIQEHRAKLEGKLEAGDYDDVVPPETTEKKTPQKAPSEMNPAELDDKNKEVQDKLAASLKSNPPKSSDGPGGAEEPELDPIGEAPEEGEDDAAKAAVDAAEKLEALKAAAEAADAADASSDAEAAPEPEAATEAETAPEPEAEPAA